MGRRNKFFEEQTVIKKKPHFERIVVVTRDEWKAREPKEPLPQLPLPLNYVVVNWTDTDICEWPEACMKMVKGIQDDHMDNQGLPDIRYNFLVGSDMQIYEGRGWTMGPTYPLDIRGAEELNGKCIEIAFISKNMEQPTADQADAALKFLALQMHKKNIVKPVEFKGILNGKFVRFSKLFQGDLVHPFMMDDDDKAERAKMMEFADGVIKERQSIIAERRDFVMRETDEVLAMQREIIKSKTAEEIAKEYGFTEDVDVSKIDFDRIEKAIPKDVPPGEGEATAPA